MLTHVDQIVANLEEVERALARDVREQQKRWRYRLHSGRVWFDAEMRHAHKRFKQSVPAFLRDASLLNVLTTPIIYSLGVPFLLVDLWVTAYQWICFPIYGIPLVSRRLHFVIDRHKLAYLNAIEQANCLYCSYATGVIGYMGEVAARTERYWCPIKHSRVVPTPHKHYQQFFDYGDAAGYRQGLSATRKALARSRPTTTRGDKSSE